MQGLLYCPGHNSESENLKLPQQKWNFFKILFVKKMKIININNEKNWSGCDDALLIYAAPKSSTVYVVKWVFLGLQRAPENSVLAPSHTS